MAKPTSSPPLRRSSRVIVRVPVTVTGKRPNGKTFSEDTDITSISKYGARLKTELPLTIGTEVRVRPKQRAETALFRVVWTGRDGSPRAGEVGIEYVEVSNLLGVTFPE